MSLTDDAMGQVERLFRENQQLRVERDEWHRQNGLLRGELEQVRAKSAGLRARLGETEWGQPRTEWTWAVRRPDGQALLAPWAEEGRPEDEVRREFAGVVESMGYRKVLLCRTVEAWHEVDEGGDRG